jgi:purine-nucleoside phosphorylase
MSRAYLCAKSAIDWDTATDARRSAAIAGARQALIGSELATIHAARVAADPTLPAFESLTATELAALEMETESVIALGANEHAITIANVSEGPGVSIRSSWYERSLLQRLGIVPEATPHEDPALRRFHASWLIQRS